MITAKATLERRETALSPSAPHSRPVGSLTLAELASSVNLHASGERMYQLVSVLYPICRSITGEGFRESLRQVREHVPLEVREVPTGTQVFDWTVPREWNIRDAWVKDAHGEKV